MCRPRGQVAQVQQAQHPARLVHATPCFVYNTSDESKAAAQMNGNPDSSLEISTASLQAASFRRS